MEKMDTVTLLKQVRRIEMRTNRAVDEIFGGAWHSIFRGRGVEFDEVREYSDGDEVRDIDWSVTARTGRPFVKKYVEERELSVMLLVDASASEHFGGRGRNTKLACGVECAAMLALSAVRNHDKVGMALFTDRIERFIPPAGGRKHSLRLIREMLGFRPASRLTDINAALREIYQIQKRRSIIFLISDMEGSAADYAKALRLVNSRHDVVAVRISDGNELRAPAGFGGNFMDPETGMICRLSPAGRDMGEYARLRKEEVARVRETCADARVDMVDMTTEEDPVTALTGFFRRRSVRRRSL